MGMFKKTAATLCATALLLGCGMTEAKGYITVYGPGAGQVDRVCTGYGGAGGASRQVQGFYWVLDNDNFYMLPAAQRTLAITVASHGTSTSYGSGNGHGGSGMSTGGGGGGATTIYLSGTRILSIAGGGGGGGGYATGSITSYAGHTWHEQHNYSTCSSQNGGGGGTVSDSVTASSGNVHGGNGASYTGGGGGGGANGGTGGSSYGGGNAGTVNGQKSKTTCTATDLVNEITCRTPVTNATGNPFAKIRVIRELIAVF